MTRILRIEPDDDRFEEARALDLQLLHDAPTPSANTEWWIAERDGAIVGYAGARLLDDGCYYLSRAGVVPEARGAGLQRRLIQARVQRGKKLGALLIVTYTLPSNAPSSNSLIATGFRTYMPAHAYAGDDVIYWYYRGSRAHAIDPLPSVMRY